MTLHQDAEMIGEVLVDMRTKVIVARFAYSIDRKRAPHRVRKDVLESGWPFLKTENAQHPRSYRASPAVAPVSGLDQVSRPAH